MIIGVHVAGDVKGGLGMSEALCAETFAFLTQKAKIKDVVEANMFDKTTGFIAPQTDVLLLGAVQKCMAHRETGISQVIPTECSGEIFPIYCAPPVLSKYDVRIQDNPYSPMQEGVNKHGLVTKNFDLDYLETAYDDLNNKILSFVKPCRIRVGKLPVEMAIVGHPSLPHYDKLDFDTSEGFPYSAMRSGSDKGKKWLLDLEQDANGVYTLNGLHPFLEEVMESKHNQRLKRHLPFTLFVDCLKDRKLPITKAITPGKVRIFSISPLDFTIQCRQVFMDFTVAYQEARFAVEHAVGIDVNSYEWTDMVNSLLDRGNNIITLDYKGYGPSLNALCAEYSIRIIRNWYMHNGDLSTENDLCREMMGYEQIHSAHLCMKMVYRTLCGLPSGGPLTVILNSLVNCLYIRITWIIIFTENLDYQSPSMSAFAAHVTFFVYGDDVIMSVTDEVKDYYNSLTMADVLQKHNIGISNAAKDNEMVKYLSCLDKDTSFLKHNILPHPKRPGVFLAALDRTSVEDTCNWTFKTWKYKLREISLESCDATVRSAYGHGPDYFNVVRQKCQIYWQKKGVHLPLPTWRDIDRQNFG
nr:RdRp [Wugcerasp virus 14]